MGDRGALGSTDGPSGSDELLLELRGIDFSYGPLQVLFSVDLSVPRGGRVALLGTNGAGKSTLLRVAAGLFPPDRGEIRFRGRDVTGLEAERRVREGLALLEGGRTVFPSLSVRENLVLGAYPWLHDTDLVTSRLAEGLEIFPQLQPKLGQRAGTLSGGEQQMLALARALMTGPDLLMIDELSLGLAPAVLADVAAAVDRMTRRGLTLLLVEQSLNVAAELADDSYFLEKGEVRFRGPTGELLERGDLARSVFFGAPS